MKIPVAKYGITVDVPVETWPASVQENAMRVGLGRIVNDSHANVARRNFPTGEAGTEAWRDAGLTQINARIANLALGDVRQGNPTVAELAAQVAAQMKELEELRAFRAAAEKTRPKAA